MIQYPFPRSYDITINEIMIFFSKQGILFLTKSHNLTIWFYLYTNK